MGPGDLERVPYLYHRRLSHPIRSLDWLRRDLTILDRFLLHPCKKVLAGVNLPSQLAKCYR